MRRVVLAAVIAVSAAWMVGAGSASTSPAGDAAFVDTAQVQGRADFVAESAGAISPGARTIPTWRGSFDYGGTVYPYSMVGTNPAAGAARTVVPVVLVPLDLHFKDGLRGDLRGSDRVADVTGSPIFRP